MFGQACQGRDAERQRTGLGGKEQLGDCPGVTEGVVALKVFDTESRHPVGKPAGTVALSGNRDGSRKYRSIHTKLGTSPRCSLSARSSMLRLNDALNTTSGLLPTTTEQAGQGLAECGVERGVVSVRGVQQATVDAHRADRRRSLSRSSPVASVFTTT